MAGSLLLDACRCYCLIRFHKVGLVSCRSYHCLDVEIVVVMLFIYEQCILYLVIDLIHFNSLLNLFKPS